MLPHISFIKSGMCIVWMHQLSQEQKIKKSFESIPDR